MQIVDRRNLAPVKAPPTVIDSRFSLNLPQHQTPAGLKSSAIATCPSWTDILETHRRGRGRTATIELAGAAGVVEVVVVRPEAGIRIAAIGPNDPRAQGVGLDRFQSSGLKRGQHFSWERSCEISKNSRELFIATEACSSSTHCFSFKVFL